MVNTEQKRVTSAEIYGENNQQGEKKKHRTVKYRSLSILLHK